MCSMDNLAQHKYVLDAETAISNDSKFSIQSEMKYIHMYSTKEYIWVTWVTRNKIENALLIPEQEG